MNTTHKLIATAGACRHALGIMCMAVIGSIALVVAVTLIMTLEVWFK